VSQKAELKDYGIDAPLPANVDAERTILGAIIKDNETFFDDTLDIQAEDFHLESHRKIFLCINEILFGMVEGIRHVDDMTLAEELRKRKWLDNVGGISYVMSLSEGIYRNIHIEEHVRIVKDKARLRKLMGIFNNGLNRAQDQSESADQIRSAIQDQLGDEEAEGSSHSVEIGSCIPAVEERINKSRVISEERTALDMTWGLSGLDEFTKGVFGGEFTIISGEASGGKTSFAVQMTLANAREGIPCAWFSMEMSKEQICQRYYAAMSEILTADHTRDPRLMTLHTHIPEMRRVSEELARLPIWIDDTSPLRVDKLRSRIRMMARKYKIRLFVVDYVQLLKGMPGLRGTEQFADTIYMLRDIPKQEPDIHLAVLSQYSKADGFMKKKGRTAESNYGGSVINHAAQNMLMISIEDPEKVERGQLLEVNIKIAKQREGKRGKIDCFYDRDHLRFCYPQRQMI
jgi:replicative DNA helicase